MGLGDLIFMVPALPRPRQDQIPEFLCRTMRAEKGSQSHDFDPKNWNPVFLETRHFKGDKECEDGKGDEKGEEVEEDEQGDGILDFLRYFEDLVSTTAAHETAKFCGNVQLDDLKERVGTAGNKFAAWLDDRSRSGEAREYSNRLTAIDLYQLLKSKVWDKPQNLF